MRVGERQSDEGKVGEKNLRTHIEDIHIVLATYEMM